MMRFYYDEDADLAVLANRTVGIIGYGNQGRAQALNLRDSGITVMVGTQQDATQDQAQADGFQLHSIEELAAQADIIALLVPDEVAPEVYEQAISAHMREGKTLLFASGYNVTFSLINFPPHIDVIMIAPKMLGEGMRQRYLKGIGFPSFFAVHQDASGHARETALALAHAIGSTRMGVLEVTMRDETVMDLFNEQGFGPLLGRCLIAAYQVLVDAGLPPEAVLLELYMSGELGFIFQTMAENGILAQLRWHSLTSQYGSLTRSTRVDMAPFITHLNQVLEEIQSGDFAKEWLQEKETGYPILKMLREGGKHLPMHEIETKLRAKLRQQPSVED